MLPERGWYTPCFTRDDEELMHGEMPAPTAGTVQHRFGVAKRNWFREQAFPLFLMLASPPAVVSFWIAARHFDGSLLALAEGIERVPALWPWPSLEAAAMIAVWVSVQAALLRWLPGKRYEGPATPMGNRPRYRLNGIAAFAATHALWWLCAYPLNLFSPTIVYDRFGELLMTLSVAALALCIALFVKGTRFPSSSDAGRSGSFLWDFYWGVELHPSAWGMSLKQLFNCRVAMMGWSIIVLSFAAAQHALTGVLSTAMAVSVALQVAYIFKFFVWESGYFASLDIMHDRFGFYIAWGVLAWLPGVYTLAPLYLVTHPGDLSLAAGCAISAFGILAIFVNYQADAQRQRVRQTNGRTQVWGARPELIVARYRTADGRTRQNLLLASGWWGIARHFHYTAEIAVAVAWTIPAGFGHLLPWFYPLFLTVLLVDRSGRDDLRCLGKYGSGWKRYCERVPWRIIPGLY